MFVRELENACGFTTNMNTTPFLASDERPAKLDPTTTKHHQTPPNNHHDVGTQHPFRMSIDVLQGVRKPAHHAVSPLRSRDRAVTIREPPLANKTGILNGLRWVYPAPIYTDRPHCPSWSIRGSSPNRRSHASISDSFPRKSLPGGRPATLLRRRVV